MASEKEIPDGETVLKEMVDGLKGVSGGPWDHDETPGENGEGHYSSSKLIDSEGQTIADATNVDVSWLEFDCPGDNLGNGQYVDMLAHENFKHFARCSPDNIRAIAAYVSTLKSERDAARAALEHDRSIVCDQYREIGAIIHSHEWTLEGRGSYAWDDDNFRDEFRNVSAALVAAFDPLKVVISDWSNCPTDAAEIAKARQDAIAELDAAQARVKVLAELLAEQTGLCGRLLTIVDSIEQDIGCETPDKIWPLLGPVNDRALEALKESG